MVADAALDVDLEEARSYLDPWLNGSDTLALVMPNCGVLGGTVATALAFRRKTLVVTGPRSAASHCVSTLKQHGLAVALLPDQEDQRATVLQRLGEGQEMVLVVPIDTIVNVDNIPGVEKIQWDGVVFDEVQRTSELAPDFDPQFDRLANVSGRLGRPPTLALVRAAPPSVRSDLPHRLGLRTPVRVDHAPVHPRLTLEVIATESRQRSSLLLQKLEGSERPALVLCSTPSEVEEVITCLGSVGIPVERLDGLHSTWSNGSHDPGMVFVAIADRVTPTHLKPRLLLHFRSPASLEQYCRDLSWLSHGANDGRSIVFFTPDDESHTKSQLDRSRPKPEEIVAFCVALERHASTEGTVLIDTLCVSSGFNRTRVEPLVRLLVGSGWIETEGDFVRILRDRASLPERARFLAARIRTARERDIQRLRSMSAYALSKNCRQESIRRHFGTTLSRPCGKCDACRNPMRQAAGGRTEDPTGPVAARPAPDSARADGQSDRGQRLITTLFAHPVSRND